ncbi:MAG TPA: phosphate/phosphite/phosphonate ABC transporter substrate-binding protein, partial [Gammaproteobacteria bacterium]|nr:phosphate/phosphite/phosphonate ABC transporter substrate-binding protein [Gammaproteobacteria bacterium]
DLFYVNSHVFYRLKSEGRAVPVAQMENVEGHVTSRSQIFVRSDSGIETVEQLQGKRLAFISPMGAGGYLAPRAYLRRMGVNTGEEVFTRNLSSSLHEVLLGDIDAGTMCGVNYRLMSRKLDTGELRVIGVSDEYPENLVAARSDLAPGLVRQVATILLAMDDTPDGSEVLTAMHGMKIGRFRPYDPAVEAITRKLIQQAQVGH